MKKAGIFLFFFLILSSSSFGIVATNIASVSFEQQFEQMEKDLLLYLQEEPVAQRRGKKLTKIQKFQLSIERQLLKRSLRKLKKRISKYQNQNCDLILLKSGEEIEAKVTEINSEEIKYKRCSNPDGPTISINRADVFMIKYSNGEKEMINAVEKTKSVTEEGPLLKQEGATGAYIVGFLLGLFLFLLGGLFILFYKKKTVKRRAAFFGWALGASIALLISAIARL